MYDRVAGIALALAALMPSTASAQTARSDDDYGALVQRATEGRDLVYVEQVEERVEPVAAAPRPRPQSRPSVRLDPEVDEGQARGVFLHRASEYANEPHPVRVVDRSRYFRDFVPTIVPNTIGLTPGSILVDAKARQLYFAMPDGNLRRYGVAVGKAGAVWHGTATVGRTARWPDWRPTANIRRENRRLKRVVKGGASNPLGARAIYLYQGDRDTMYRIHGTNVPSSIGKFASHGCIRMLNEDVIELHSMVRPGATVIVR
jgi:lipoprotein-anchoring transpeptidase ErfK/SrfK